MHFELIEYKQESITKMQAKLNKWWTDNLLRKVDTVPTPEGILFKCVLNKTGE